MDMCSAQGMQSGAEVINLFFMLNSTVHENYLPHKC